VEEVADGNQSRIYVPVNYSRERGVLTGRLLAPGILQQAQGMNLPEGNLLKYIIYQVLKLLY
jgi:hypothetical protein